MNKSFFVLLLIVALCPLASAQAPGPISYGYGAAGSFTVSVEKFPSPDWNDENVSVFHPAGANAPVPTIFFAPGFDNNNPKTYIGLINHLVSRGYAVVFSPYQAVSGDVSLHKKRYDTISAGFEEAVRRYPQFLDTTRVGFAGHSYGGGAVPALAWRGLVDRGWGRDGALLFLMAPWYYFEFSLKQFVNFPPHAKLLVEIYDKDALCDHRVAKEIFDRINLPAGEKDFVMLQSESRLGDKLEAEHGTPNGGGGDEDVNALDYYGVYRLFDALADYAFTGDSNAKQIALGDGSREQRFMGVWPDGQPVRESLAGDCVSITRSSFSFLFPYFPSSPAGVTNVSSASFKAPAGLAPDSLASAFGTNLSLYPLGASEGAPLKLNGTIVKVRDNVCAERLAPLFFVAPTQVNYLLPAGTATGTATVTVVSEAGAISSSTVQINQVAPSLFTANSDGQGIAAALVLRLKADGSLAWESAARFDLAADKYVAVPIDVGNESEQVFLVLYGTGLRFRSGLGTVTARIGGVIAEVLYAGAQGGYLGLDQVNLRVPRGLAGRGEVDVALTVDGIVANTVKVRFK
ncbi:MAG TPA: hypothetical protein VFD58_12405 [Blastocatellia bacterium]|nr:hypothetical protein [Blastocatellia bacterium]